MATLTDLPIGAIIAWENLAIPSGWVVCDGLNGTPDLRDKFVRGAAIDGDVRAAGGASTHTHTNPNTSQQAAHTHSGGASLGGPGTHGVTAGSGVTVSSSGHSHTDSVSFSSEDLHDHTIGDTNSVSSLPRHVLRVFIRRNA